MAEPTPPKTFGQSISDIAEIIGQIRDGSLQPHGKFKNVAAARGSITRLLKDYIVEPIVITTHGARNSKAFDNSVTMLTNIFTSFYMQAFRIMIEHHDMSVSATVNALASDKGGSTWSILNDNIMNSESHPLYNPYRDLMLGAEKEGTFLRKNNLNLLGILDSYKKDNQYAGKTGDMNLFNQVGNDAAKNLEERKNEDTLSTVTRKERDGNMSISKVLADANSDPLYKTHVRQITLTFSYQDTFDDGKRKRKGDIRKLEIPIMIKTTVIAVPVNEIVGLLDHNSPDTNFVDRLIGLFGGTVKFRDFILAGDLIERYKQNRIRDKTGILKIVRDRSSKRELDNKSVMRGFDNYYNMMLMTVEDKLQIDKMMGVSIHEERGKERFLRETRSICGLILDEDYERITMLVSNIRGISTFGYKALKNKKEMDAFEDIMKAILATKPVSF